MSVLLDATAIPVDRGGVGRYLDGLVPALAARDDLTVRVVCQHRDAGFFAAHGVDTITAPERIAARPARLAWEQARLPALVRSVRADVLHSPHYTMPIRCSAATTVTLHDATFFSDPDLHTPTKRRFFSVATRTALRRADALVVPSAATRDELARLVSPRAERAFVAHHGVDPAVFHPASADEIARLRARLDLGTSPFIAFLGTIEPRKNVPNLIRAWVAACEGRNDPPALVLAGGAGWDHRVDDVAASVPAALKLLRPGYLPLDELPALLGGADFVAYPALGEGFGLPLIEAMSCGSAVLTTRRLALPEVGGEAVEYSEPDVPSLTSAIARLLDDVGRRQELATLARDRAALFTWERAADVHVAAYRQALAQ